MFNEVKFAQVVALLMQAAPGSRLNKLKLIKLVYLADRQALVELGSTITGDRFVSMPHGPVPSQSLNVVNGDFNINSEWNRLITDLGDYTFGLTDEGATADASALSRAEHAVVAAVWSRFGGMDKWQLRDWTHEHCAEWRDPAGSSLPISLLQMAIAAGMPESVAKDQLRILHEQEELDELLASL